MPKPAQPTVPAAATPATAPDPWARGHGFVHLHLHTEYSLLDGGNRTDKLVARVKALGMPAVAVTDHGNLFGALAFYNACKDAGVKPILGCEAYISPGRHTDRTHTGVRDGGHHLVLLCENETGWRNLMRLASIAYLEGFYYKPRIDHETLEAHSDGLIAINGHLGSELAFHLVEFEKTRDDSHWRKALEVARWHARVFAPSTAGPRFYVELQRHIAEQNAINKHLVRLASELSLPLVATNDAHFLLEEDHDAHDTLICISTGKLKTDSDRLRYPRELFVKSPAQMREAFSDCPESCDATLDIARRCNLDLSFESHAPVVRVVPPASPRAYNGEEDLTAWFKSFCADYRVEPWDSTRGRETPEDLARACDLALRQLCSAGLVWRYGPGFAPGAPPPADAADRARRDDILARLDRELTILADKRISAYFLVVWDFVNWGRQRGIPALARGSGVGTMVGYVLGLSNACPVRYGLLFERFTDPDRAEYPDIDIDLCQDGRADVINFVRDKYGHVAQIITFGTLKARAAIRDVGRVFAMPLPDVDRIAKLVPETLHITLDDALEQAPDLRKLYEDDDQIRRLIDNARTIEGQARHASVHAAGVIVATRPLEEIVPLYKAPGSDDVVTQWDGPTCEKVGLLKMDFLGLRTLSVIERAKKLIRDSMDDAAIRRAVGWPDDRKGDPLDLDRLTFDDQRVFELFRRADTTGVFQFESGGMRRLLSEMKPDRLEDLIAANALFRPGPMDLIPDYNARKHGHNRAPSIHPIVDKHTAETYGVMVYQEQVMLIVHELGDIPLRAAYTLIKAISKKKASVIDANRPKFIEGAAAKGLSRRAADELFELILKFAGYGFNKSHSTGYAIVAYQTAFLKAFFPVHYMAAFLTYESQAQKVSDWIPYLEDCRKTLRPDGRVGVEVRPPDVNVSDSDFSVVYEADEPHDNIRGHMRFGLRAIKGVGSRAIDAIVEERRAHGPFASLHEFCERVPAGFLNKATVEALIKCGAFDALHGRAARAAMCATIEDAVSAGQTLARDRAAGQGGLFGAPDPAAAPNAPAAPEAAPPLARALPWTEKETLTFEKDALGFYVSSHPLDEWRARLAQFATTTTPHVREAPQDTPVVVGGVVQSVRALVTKNGRSAGARMAIATIEDHAGVCEAVLFAETFKDHAAALRTDAIVLLVGRVDRRRGEGQIVVDRVVPIEDAPLHLASRVDLVIDESVLGGLAGPTLNTIAGRLRSQSRGSLGGVAAPLRFIIRAAGSRVVLDSREQLTADRQTLAELEELLGAGNVRVVGPAATGLRPPAPRQRPQHDRPRRAEPSRLTPAAAAR